MNPHIATYYQFIKEQHKHNLKSSADSFLELLWQHYTIGHSIDCEKIRMHFESVVTTLSPLSQKRQRTLLRTVVDLCLEHERIAFIEGVQIGAQLAAEITNDTELYCYVSTHCASWP